MTDVIERISHLMNLRGVKARSLKPTLARVCGISYQAVSQWFDGSTSNIKNEHLMALAEEYDTTVDWLLSGKGDAPQAEAPKGQVKTSAELVREMLSSKSGKMLNAEARQRILAAAAEPANAAGEGSSNVIVADFSRSGPVGDEISIAHYDIRGAMGNGQVPADYMEMLKDVRVSESHLRKIGVTFDDPNHLKMVYGWGYSMTPTIKHADPMIVNINIREFDGDGIFIFTWQGHLYIKRLQVQDADHFEMISDNKQHKDRVIRMDETYIHARVLLVWNAQLV
ncbi:XRE family transcriptional regulator [Pseudomonas nicosulfuronedens]|uniref:XRE family transcriptional regulator n=1 Tax=Pseudomonas nicosulfuronedens TaxID=2571105 RepID=UPI0024472256|nr:XRE family transcriptional regulator [Pseudomonas nicosulfuronedens]MDH1012011.1 XRE family transcriptional regulator [Pseudomonas nicosulfuronedens]MDH1980621.1 XRE family transcriptional regulator [Pseudomonas nicosulfuronedens]MDH2027571.1 XRE family transcriptional regulator [Pseudomonas nicosulfuronedens]